MSRCKDYSSPGRTAALQRPIRPSQQQRNRPGAMAMHWKSAWVIPRESLGLLEVVPEV